MDIVVSAGTTKAKNGATLAAHSFEAASGERACLLLHTEGTGKVETLEEECLRVVQHSLLSSEGEPWHRLDGTLKELNGLFKGVLLGKTVEDIHAVVTLIDASGGLHVSHAGRGEAYLVRSGSTSQITEFTRGRPVSSFVHISSGAMEEGDIVVLATQRILRAFTPAQLAGAAGRKGALDEIISGMEAEREPAAIAVLSAAGEEAKTEAAAPTRSRGALPSRRDGNRIRPMSVLSVDGLRAAAERVLPFLSSAARGGAALGKRGARMSKDAAPKLASASGAMMETVKGLGKRAEEFLADLRHPQRKRRAHLLLLAGAVAAFLIILLVVNLLTSTQRSKTRAELSQLVTEIESQIRTADNNKLSGDNEKANKILQSAEEQAKQVMDNESGLFRTEALDLLDRIHQKQEELNNIIRLSPRVLVNVSSKTPDVKAQGIIGLGDGEMIVYDRQNSYRVLLNRLDDPRPVAEEELVLQGTAFPRYNSQIFMTTGDNLIEMSSSQLTPMKTEDPDGWKTGKDMEAYLRYLYVLAPDDKQIYKYERLTNRYGPPSQYNVNGDLTGALDMSIDGSVYVLKEGGTILKLLRGEIQPFAIRALPKDALKNATKVYKVVDGKFYFLDPEARKVIVVTDGGLTGEAAYEKQYVLEGEQVGALVDLFADAEENHLYVLDEKRVYAIDLVTR